jgi:uncharacterized protein YndB with AHSA1/START domain
MARLESESSTEKVFKALTEEKGLAGWWSKYVIASPVAGAVNIFRFGDWLQ